MDRDTGDAGSAALLLQANLGQPRIWVAISGRLRHMPVVCGVELQSQTSLAGCVQNLRDVKYN